MTKNTVRSNDARYTITNSHFIISFELFHLFDAEKPTGSIRAPLICYLTIDCLIDFWKIKYTFSFSLGNQSLRRKRKYCVKNSVIMSEKNKIVFTTTALDCINDAENNYSITINRLYI